MNRAFTLLEVLIVTLLLLTIVTFIGIVTSNVTSQERYNQSKEQLRNYIIFNKYHALSKQTNLVVEIDIDKNALHSPFDGDIGWLADFTNDITIVSASTTNIAFNIDGGISEEITLDIQSNDGTMSNRLIITTFGTVNFEQIVNTNDIETDEQSN